MTGLSRTARSAADGSLDPGLRGGPVIGGDVMTTCRLPIRASGALQAAPEAQARSVAGNWRITVAVVALVAHVILLFFSPLPPLFKGSLWSRLLGYGAAFLLAWEVARPPSRIMFWWFGLGRAAQRFIVWSVAAGVLALAALLRSVSLERYERFTAPVGLFEPLTLLVYLAGAATLLRAAAGAAGPRRATLAAAGGVLAAFALEELDYFSILGGLIGRVNGVYVGALHDLLTLAWKTGGMVGLAAMSAGALAVALLAAGRLGLLRRVVLRTLLARPRLVLLVAAAGCLVGAQVMDAGMLAGLTPPTFEEPFELAGSVFLGGYALDLAVTDAVG